MEPKLLLKQAVANVTDEIKSGSSPHAAMVKVSKNLNLNTNFIKRASEIINVALTYNHFKKHADQKDVDFPIIDASKVAADIYDNNIEKKASTKNNSSFSIAVCSDEIPNYSRLLNPKYKKAYHDILDSPEKNTEFDLSEKGVYEKSAQLFDLYERHIDDLKVKQADAKERFISSFCALSNEFRKDANYRTSFYEFEKQANALFGSEGTPFIDMVFSLIDNTCEKRAENLDEPYSGFKKCKEVCLFENFINHSNNFNKYSSELSALLNDYEESKEKVKKAYHEYGKKYLNDFKLDETENLEEISKEAQEKIDVFESNENDIQDPVLKQAMQKITDMESSICPIEEKTYLTEAQINTLPVSLKKKIISSKKLKGQNTAVKVGSSVDMLGVLGNLYKDRATPSNGASSIDNLDRSLMLQNMMYTDPILSGKKPRQVLDAYQQIVRLAPELSNEKEVVRAMLRQMVESQAVDPHTASQLIEANSSFKKQKTI